MPKEPTQLHSPMDAMPTDCEGKPHAHRAARCQGSSSQYPLYLPYLEEAGAVTYGKVGDADAILIDALLCTEVVWRTRAAARKMK